MASSLGEDSSYLMDELRRSETIHQQHCYRRPYFFERGFVVKRGSVPVMLSAPHAAPTVREKRVHVREPFVAAIVEALHKRTGAWCMYTDKRIDDPNHYHDGPYKREIAKIARSGKVGLLLDVHGASDDKHFEIDIGTGRGRTLLGRKDIVKELKRNLAVQGIRKISENFFGVSGRTVASFAAEEGIPSVQLELRRDLRTVASDGLMVNFIQAVEKSIPALLKAGKNGSTTHA